MEDNEKVVFRIFVKPRHSVSERSEGREFFVEAECENAAVMKVLEYVDASESFGSIHVDKLDNGTIIL